MTEGRTESRAPEAPAPAAAPQKVLRRSRDDRVIAGVAGGLGRYFGVDPVLLRIAFILLLFAGGSGLLLYVIGWLVIPQERPGDEVGTAPSSAGGGAELLGLVLIGLGAFFLLRLLLPDVFAARYVWPVVLILIGAALVLRAARR